MKREFKTHKKLLMDVITRQAGTLAKGVCEGVTNSIDAKATYCHILINENRIVIADNGKGFRNKEEVTKYFEVFGQPHADEEGKVYGEFRMGRGQLFAFGRNVWETGTFRMTVDIKEDGLEYQLEEDRPIQEGCKITIDLYDSLSKHDIHSIQEELEEQLRFVEIKLNVNGKEIGQRPSDLDRQGYWTHSNSEYYTRLDDREPRLVVYNMGMKAQSFGPYTCGTGGVVVSRKPLKMNFARNLITYDCPLFNKIERRLQKWEYSRYRKLKRLTENQAVRVCCMVNSRVWSVKEFMDTRFLRVAGGKLISPREALTFKSWSCNQKVTDREADALFQEGSHLVLSETDGTESSSFFVESLHKKFERDGLPVSDIKLIEPQEAVANLHRGYEEIPESEYGTEQLVWVKALEETGSLIADKLFCITKDPHFKGKKPRICLGKANAEAWTDGQTYIAFNVVNFLPHKHRAFYGAMGLLTTLVHEYCHTEPDLMDNNHDHDFYWCYHEATQDLSLYYGRLEEELLRQCEIYGLPRARLTPRSKQLVESRLKSREKCLVTDT